MLFDTYELGDIQLKNRIVMAPMTRSRAINNVPNDLMATYYGQRAGAGLIITEGTAPSPNGLGYARIPGVFTSEQAEGWKKVTSAVHEKDAKIFIQVMHTGRVSHPANQPAGSRVVAPSAIQLSGEMYTDEQGPQAYPVPEEMNEQDIQEALNEYANAARHAKAAGFDGVEMHAANGYLLEQFLNANTNHRTDGYGGSKENRARFVLEAVQKSIDEIGDGRVGIRLSPFGVFNDTGSFDGIEEAFAYLAAELKKLGVVYIHIVDHQAMGAPEVPDSIKSAIAEAFGGTIILSGGYETKERAEADLSAGKGDLVAFGRPFLANPDLPVRLEKGLDLQAPDFDTFYTPGEKGYTDYPTA